jgi:putative transposase
VEFAELWRRFEKTVGRSWRCDETYIKVGGQWTYLYRAVDERAAPWNPISAAVGM